MDPRTVARLVAVQALYELEANGSLPAGPGFDFGGKAKELAQTNNLNRVNKKIFESILTAVAASKEAFDEKIKANLSSDWSIERIGGVLRAILRASLAESATGTAKAVIISEYVGITAGFYDDREVKFVNAILDKLI